MCCVAQTVSDDAPKAAEKQIQEKEDKPETNEAVSTNAQPAATAAAVEEAPAAKA